MKIVDKDKIDFLIKTATELIKSEKERIVEEFDKEYSITPNDNPSTLLNKLIHSHSHTENSLLIHKLHTFLEIIFKSKFFKPVKFMDYESLEVIKSKSKLCYKRGICSVEISLEGLSVNIKMENELELPVGLKNNPTLEEKVFLRMWKMYLQDKSKISFDDLLEEYYKVIKYKPTGLIYKPLYKLRIKRNDNLKLEAERIEQKLAKYEIEKSDLIKRHDKIKLYLLNYDKFVEEIKTDLEIFENGEFKVNYKKYNSLTFS